MASALLEALAIPAVEINREMLRPQFSQFNVQLQQRMKKPVEPPGCQNKGHLFLLYLGTFCLKAAAKGRSLADPKAFLAVQHRRALLDIGPLVCPFIHVIITVLKLFCDGVSVCSAPCAVVERGQ